MNKRRLIFTALVILILSACDQLPSSTEEDTLATAVAATLEAVPQGESTSAPTPPEPTQKPESTSTIETQSVLEVSMQQYLLAYTNDGNLWSLSPGGSGQQVNVSGDVVAVHISDNREVIVYIRQSSQPDLFEVRAVDADGANDRQILSRDTLDSLYPLEGAQHYLTSQLEFIPGTHSLLFNTRAVFDGPGLVKNDDLFRLDVNSGELIQILPRESGGDFVISPDGTMLALSRPDSIAMAAIDGSDLRPELVNFQPIITYSEYQYYPLPVWSPDSSRFGVFIPSSDPLADDTSGAVWILPVGGSPLSFPPIQGQVFFPQANRGSLLSPDLETVAFLREQGQGGEDTLFIANLDGSNSRVYDQGAIHWIGWNQTGTHFAFRLDDAKLTLGNPSSNPQPLTAGRTLRWVSSDMYIIQSGQRGNWTLTLGKTDGLTTPLVQPAGNSLVFDLR